MSITPALPNLPSVEGLLSGHTENHPNGVVTRQVVRYLSGSIDDNHYRPDGIRFRWIWRCQDGSIEDRHYQPDGTIAQWVVRWPDGRICDHYYNPDETKAVTIRYVP